MVNNIIHEYIRAEKSKVLMANIFRKTMHYKRCSIANWYEFAIKPALLIDKNWLHFRPNTTKKYKFKRNKVQ